MIARTRLLAAVASAGVLATALAGATGASGAPDSAGPLLTRGVTSANPATPGFSSANMLSPGLVEFAVATGATRLENGTADLPAYGYRGDGPFVPLAGTTAEATKTEPDKNTYLVLKGQTGADAAYSYGTHFLFQGHENAGALTRINLDADSAHRVTLLATTTVDGKPLPTFDGSTWDPFAGRLLLTAELASEGGVYAATLGVPAQVEDVSMAMGREGYEGVQTDSAGNVWLVADAGGSTGTGATADAKQPNSFVYRFVPRTPGSLKRGQLQVLQVISNRTDQPIVFGDRDADILSLDRKDLHTYGRSFKTRWVTIHDTAADRSRQAFDANALAKASKGTPFKRPENGVFRPGTAFTQFFFTETGDTNAETTAGSTYGGFGGVYSLRQSSPDAATGTLRLVVNGDVDHTAFDNLSFLTRDQLLVVEDRGDTLHAQHNALDSGWAYDVTVDYGAGASPVRWLAEGRDASATLDSSLAAADTPGFANDGDNEITGIHVSNGDPGISGILGAQVPKPFTKDASPWRVFWTQQHGDNVTYEVIRHP